MFNVKNGFKNDRDYWKKFLKAKAANIIHIGNTIPKPTTFKNNK